MTYANFKLDIDGDGVALVTWDMPERSMNLITLQVIDELGAIVAQIAGDAAVNGAVIASGKDTFCAGADLTLLEELARTYATFAEGHGEEEAARQLARLVVEFRTRAKPKRKRHQLVKPRMAMPWGQQSIGN